MHQLSNWSQSKQLRQTLRRDATPAEVCLWGHLRQRRLDGHKFRRQHSLGRYIVDFYCPQLSLAIELDGDSHFQEDRFDYDRRRQKWLERSGIQIIRFQNDEVLEDIEGVLVRLSLFITQITTAA